MRSIHLSKSLALATVAIACSAVQAGIVMEDKPNPERKAGGDTSRTVDRSAAKGAIVDPNIRQGAAVLSDQNGKKAIGTVIDPKTNSPKEPVGEFNFKK